MKGRDGEGSVWRLLLGYLLGAWAALNIVMTVSELAGLPLVVPRVFGLILVGGLAVVLGMAVVKQVVHAVERASTTWGQRKKNFFGLAIFLATLPGSFYRSDGSLEWIMWRDAPLLALASGVLAIAAGIAWRLSPRRASSGADGSDTGGPPPESEPAI